MAANPPWTREDDKRFELALLQFPEDSPSGYFLDNIALLIHKRVEEVTHYYDALVYDVALIESGMFALPNYPEDEYVPHAVTEASQSKYKENEKKKGTPWSKKEHESFLYGLIKYGKGDWKSISRECVKTRNATQVASHAQKYFLRQSLESEARKRSSIHDITLGDADKITVPRSNLESMDQQPHLGDQIPPAYYPSQDSFGHLLDAGEVYTASFEEL